MTQAPPFCSLLPAQNTDVMFEDAIAATLGPCSNKLGTQDSRVASPDLAKHVQPGHNQRHRAAAGCWGPPASSPRGP